MQTMRMLYENEFSNCHLTLYREYELNVIERVKKWKRQKRDQDEKNTQFIELYF